MRTAAVATGAARRGGCVSEQEPMATPPAIRLASSAAAHAAALAPAAFVASPARIPLTTIERRFWLLHRLCVAPVANIGRALTLRGPVNVDAWVRAFAAVAAAPSLRRRIDEDDDGPFGHLGSPAALAVAAAAAAAAAVVAVVSAPYDLARDAPFRGRLLRLAADEWRLVPGAHHTALDGWPA